MIQISPTAHGRKAQLDLAEVLRAEGMGWVEIATVLRARYPDHSPRAALRLAHGWSQNDAADQWNRRWPAQQKIAKNFSYWEKWPSSTGHAPSLQVLDRLAQLYECPVTALLTDCADYTPTEGRREQSNEAAALSTLLELQEELPVPLPLNLMLLAQRLIDADINTVARFASSWARQLESEENARLLLLKLSAGLTLAVESETADDSDRLAVEPWEDSRSHHDLSGIWRSQYSYRSSTRGDHQFDAEHYIVVRQEGIQVLGQSLPHTIDSQLRLRLVLDGSIATGLWKERTSPSSYYQGASYHGGIQLVVDPRGRRMTGKWLGFGGDFQINVGDWRLTWVEASTSKAAQKAYHYKA